MKKLCLIIVFLVLFGINAFGEEDKEEVDFLLFWPNLSDRFVNETRAGAQLDNIANYLKNKELTAGQIHIYGYAAHAMVDIDLFVLSVERANFILNELVKRGVSRDLFASPIGYGATSVWGNNTSEEARYLNRRVRVVLDGTILTPEITTVIEIEAEPEPELQIAAKEPVVKEKTEFKFPLWPLLFLLLLPLFFLLFRKRDKKPKEKKERPAAPPKVKPAPAPVAEKTPAPQHVPQAASVVTPVSAPVAEKTPEPQPVVPPVLKPQTAPADAPVETVVDIVDLEEIIRKRAYYYFLGHCDQYWNMDEDWYTALPKVRAEYERNGYQTYIENGTWWAKKTEIIR
ncbi:MAG: OmpA family protein [Treponema sp.]|nr:OmpA family protein [Treponema sp.]